MASSAPSEKYESAGRVLQPDRWRVARVAEGEKYDTLLSRAFGHTGQAIEEMGKSFGLQPWMTFAIVMTVVLLLFIGGGWMYTLHPDIREFMRQQWGLLLGVVVGLIGGRMSNGGSRSRGA